MAQSVQLDALLAGFGIGARGILSIRSIDGGTIGSAVMAVGG